MASNGKLLLALLVGMLIDGAASAATLQEQLVGTWTLVGTEATAPGDSRTPATGILVFTGDGRFAQIEVVAGVSKAASTSRVRGPEAEDGTAKESVSLFGSYTVDEDARTITYRIDSSTLPNEDGTEHTRAIQALTTEELGLG